MFASVSLLGVQLGLEVLNFQFFNDGGDFDVVCLVLHQGLDDGLVEHFCFRGVLQNLDTARVVLLRLLQQLICITVVLLIRLGGKNGLLGP